MRVTIRLEEQLLREARKRARDSGRTLSAVIEDALREAFARDPADAAKNRISLLTVAGRLQPGVNLDDSAALPDLMEGRS